MSKNLIDELISDPKYKTSFNNADYFLTQCAHQDNDSTSFLNIIDQEILNNNQVTGDSYSPSYNICETANNGASEQPAQPDVKSVGLDQNFEEMLVSKLPQVFAVDRTSIQYQVIDQAYPSLSKSFQNCFNSPVLDLLIVVLDSNKLVSFYQGYFAGIPTLTNELINLTGKYWKSLISNNDDNAWENHFRSVSEKYNSKNNYEPEFEAGPVIRCRLRHSSNSQFNQQFNYFFVQLCSFMIQLPSNHFPANSMEYSPMDTNIGGINNYLASYINIVRECDTEYALKGSAAASLQKVITNSTCITRQKIDNNLDVTQNKQLTNNNNNSRNYRRNLQSHSSGIGNQLSVNISSPTYPNMDQSSILTSAPLTYPLMNNPRATDHYTNKTSPFTSSHIQHQMSHRQVTVPMNHNQYMTRSTSLSTAVDPNNQHRYGGHFDSSHHTSSSLQQCIIENRNSSNYQKVKHSINGSHMMAQHGQMYKTPIQSNHGYYLQTAQSIPQNCSLTSSNNSFMPARHVIQMPSNSMLMSPDQYFRNNGHQINLMDTVQVVPQSPMMTVVQPMSVASNHSSGNYYHSTAQNQILHNPLHINTSMTKNQSQFVSSSVSPYCNPQERGSMPHHHDYTNDRTSSRKSSQTPIKQENYDINFGQKNWVSNPILDSTSSSLLTNNPISMDIVEEILQAEEAKSENKSLDHDLSKSDSSDSLMGYLKDFMNVKTHNSPSFTSNSTISSANAQLLNLKNIKSESKTTEFRINNNIPHSNPQIANSVNNLKTELLKNLDSAQRIHIKKIVNQYKAGKIKKITMCQQINQFLNQTLGSQTYRQQVITFWNSQQQYPLADNVDSSLSGFNYSHVIQSPEEGPGISPTEQAAQSTTDLEEEKEEKYGQKTLACKTKDKSIHESTRKHGRLKSTTKSSDVASSVYSISSTTSTGVLETLLNEHDIPLGSEKKLGNTNSNSKLSISSTTSKNQLTLDQILLDDNFSIFPNMDEKFSKALSNITTGSLRNINSKIAKSQTSGCLTTNSMGVLETLLNQKNSSMVNLRQMSTESILKHSKPSRQNSVDMFLDESTNSFECNKKEKRMKKNSLLITLLNTTQNSDRGKVLNSSNSLDDSSPNFPSRQSRTYSGSQSMSFDSGISSKKAEDKFASTPIDVFDFVDNELSYSTTSDTQSTFVTSSQSSCALKKSQNKRARKRQHSKDRSIDSEGSDKLSTICEKYMKTSTSNLKTEDKNVILTSLLENKKPRDVTKIWTSSKISTNVEKKEGDYASQTVMYDNAIACDENMDLDDIKIDDFDLENLIDISENDDEPASIITDIVDRTTINSVVKQPAMSGKLNTVTSLSSSVLDVVAPVYKMVGPIIKSDPIVPISKQSILRVSDKNSILLSAIQSKSTNSSISSECLDSERERLLRQQQQQKVCMGGDKPPVTLGHQLSLDMLSKQMKEIGPNVMVAMSVPSEAPESRRSSISRSLSGMSSLSMPIYSSTTVTTSPTSRSSYQTSCTSDITSDSNKLISPPVTCVNHQQVREGLRLLVSNRSAQNISKNNMQIHRNNQNCVTDSNLNDNITTSKSCVKDVIHYPSKLHSTTMSQKDPVYTYSNQSYGSGMTNVRDSKTSDILEDSLVNDVFGLEELVNSKSCDANVSNMDYPKLSYLESINEETKMEPSTFLSGSCQQQPSQLMGNSYVNPRLLYHHHHYAHHYHHHHQHHHHHNNPTSSVNDLNVSASKEKQNVNSGLLETLLSR